MEGRYLNQYIGIVNTYLNIMLKSKTIKKCIICICIIFIIEVTSGLRKSKVMTIGNLNQFDI